MTIEKIKQFLKARIKYLYHCYKQEENNQKRKNLQDRIGELESTMGILEDEQAINYFTERFNEKAKEDQ